MSRNLQKKVQNFAFQNNLFVENSKIIIGVSGGPDSVCLLTILSELAPKYNFKLHVAHVNYGLRKKDSKLDEKFVLKLAQKNNLEVSVLKVPKKELGINPSENHMRNIRYDFFEKIRKEKRFKFIAIAHNQDDQAETMLMRVIRGSGLQGLRAIQPKAHAIIRPLLKTSRKEIISYLSEEKLDFRIDKSNLKNVFLRNKIRNNLIPHIEKNYNPKIKETLALSASIIASDYDALFDACQKKLSQINIDFQKDSVSFDVQKFNKLHDAIQRHVLRIIITKLRKNLKNIESRHIQEIIKIAKSTKKKRQSTTFKGLKIERKGARILMKV